MELIWNLNFSIVSSLQAEKKPRKLKQPHKLYLITVF